jgi:hypothetical protein
MKKLASVICIALCLSNAIAFADTTPPATTQVTTSAPTLGWNTGILGSVGAFYLNGDYNLLSAGLFIGEGYTFTGSGMFDTVGLYVGPQLSKVGTNEVTALNLLIHTTITTIGAVPIGFGFGSRGWQSGLSEKKAWTSATTYFAFDVPLMGN